MKHTLTVCLLLFILPCLRLYPQEALTAREGELPLDNPYVTVDLDPVANDAATITAPSDRVQFQNIPFRLVKKSGAGNLFLKPIGWSAVKNEDDEYPGYIARYDSKPDPKKPADPTRARVEIPVGDYQTLWLLAATDNDAALSDVVTFRVGIAEGQARVTYHDVVARIPRAGDKTVSLPNVVKTIATPTGNIYLIRVPFAKAISQDFKDRLGMELDITKELRIAINLPDPNRFQLRPLGLPSGVHIYGLTLERSPILMEVTATEPGNVFNQPQTPTFDLNINHIRDQNGKYALQTVAERDDGLVVTNAHPEIHFIYGRSYANSFMKRTLTVPVPDRGHYNLKINLLQGDTLITSRETTFALLAPDTRKHRDESPFGTWDFGGVHFTPNDPDLLGPLYVKAGLRYGMASSILPEWGRKKYGVLTGQDDRVRGTNEVAAIKAAMAKDPEMMPPARFLTFHEGAISGPHLTRTPDVFTGKTYKMDEAEEKQFKAMQQEAEESFRAGKEAFPNVEIMFGNTVPHVLEEFLRHKFPRKLLDKIGNESGSFMRIPEGQPLDYVDNNAGLWMMRQIADHYGYKDLELRQCLEICYPGSNPGNHSEQTQAAYLVRHAMHSLAWKIPVFRPLCITDMGNSYYYSNWGSTGMCHAWPNVSPKEAYVSYATMTQMLDGAKFERIVPTGSPVVYAVEFRRKDDKLVTCLWTVRGSRELALEVPIREEDRLVNMMGRERKLKEEDDKVKIEISTDPVYLVTRRPIEKIIPGAVVQEDRPTGKTFVISPLDKLADWTIEKEPSSELEVYNFLNPRRKGDFTYREAASFDGKKDAIEVKPKLPVPGPVYLQMYSVMNLNKPVEIPGEPTEIGLMVNGNGGWGRLIFELEDAGGQRWVSIGAEQAGPPNSWMADWFSAEDFKKLKSSNLSDWNSDDPWARSFINFEGWRYLKFPLPGQYPGDGYHWPCNSQWRFSGDGVVKYPLKFKKLTVTMPEKVLYMTRYEPVPRQEIYLKDLMVSYEPAEKAFVGE